MAAAGIELLPAAATIPVVARELAAGTTGELVVAGALGVLDQERDEHGGLDPARLAARGPMVGRVAGMTLARGLTIETTLDPRREPFLEDHRIDGKAVLPGVMGIEAFVEVAGLLLPGWRLVDVEDVEFLAPFKFYRGEPRTLTVEAQLEARGDEIVAACRLQGARALPGAEAPHIVTSFTGRVRLSRVAPAPRSGVLPAASRPGVGPDDVYRVYFHGPAYRVLARAARNGRAILGRLAAPLPRDHVAGGDTIAAPRLVELCFQTAGIWEIGATGKLALPRHVDRVTILGSPPESAQLTAVVTPRADGGFDARVVDESGRVYVDLEGYRTTPLGEVDPGLREPLRAAVE
jgi:hypothetical protein